MSKKISSEGTSIQYRREMSLINPSSVSNQIFAGNNQSEFYQVETGEVIDVIYSSDHPDFINNSDIGKAKIRIVSSEKTSDEENLSWALPLNPYLISFPLKHEVVVLINLLGKLFYITSLNYFNNVNNNTLQGISDTLYKDNPDNSKEYSNVSSTIPKKGNSKIELGDTFINNNNKVKPILPKEGDTILRGRFGNNIRLGNNPDTNSPNIKISVGQSPEINTSEEQTSYEENINDIKNSIWITSDEIVDIKPVTQGSTYHLKSTINPPNKFEGNQIIFNTDRVIWNAKKDEVFIFANKGISLTSNGYIAIDSNKNIGITTLDRLNVVAKSGTFIDSPKIDLGKDAKEPVVLGDKLVKLLEELIDEMIKEIHPTGSGPSGPPKNAAQYRIIKNKLKTILSKQNKTL